MTDAAWSGELDIGPRWALFVGVGGETREHAHLAHKVVVALDEVLHPGDGVDGAEALTASAWLVGSNVVHRVRVRGSVALAFIDAGSVGLVKSAELEPALRAAVGGLRSAKVEDRIAALRTLLREVPALPDARVARATKLLRESPQSELKALAARVGLSLPRLSHLFSDRIGVSPRRYRTWGSIRRAVQSMASGISLTEAAHEAGFSDSAHFSRSFVAMFGVVPSAMARGVTLRLHDD